MVCALSQSSRGSAGQGLHSHGNKGIEGCGGQQFEQRLLEGGRGGGGGLNKQLHSSTLVPSSN